jgi:hypothetical protein
MNWKSAWRPIFEEAFEGIKPGAEGTYFVQGAEAFLPIVDSLSADQASHSFGERVNSIAAHTRHAAYYVSLLNSVARGEEVNPDWRGSWSVQTVDDGQWRLIRDDLRAQFAELVSHVDAGRVPADQGQMEYLMAQLAHAAFHLGSVRQLSELLSV